MLKRISFFIGAVLLIGGIEMGCYYDNEEDLYNLGENPDSCNVNGDISYSLDLVPLLDQNCNNTCHSADIRKGNVILDTYDNLMEYVENDQLIGTIRHDPGFSPMPQGSKMEYCEIERFEKWVAEGARDN